MGRSPSPVSSASSRTAVIRDLLRHLADADPLALNQLAGELFGEQAWLADPQGTQLRVRGAVALALESMAPAPDDRSRAAHYARRLQAIIQRCDLNGELHDVVAKDFGICQRQFYFDRRKALIRLEDLLRSQRTMSTNAGTSVAVDAVELQLDLASRFENLGDLAEARAVLNDLALQAHASIDRAVALRRLTEVLCEAGKIADAHAVLDGMQRQFRVQLPAGEEEVLVRAEVLIAQAVLASYGGRIRPAMEFTEQGIALLRSSYAVPRARLLLGEFFIIAADLHNGSGAFEDALHAANIAKTLIDVAVDPKLYVLINLYSVYAQLALARAMHRGVHANKEALEIARHNGFVRYESIALSNLCVMYSMRGDYLKSLCYGERALLLAKHTATPYEWVVVLRNLAQVESAMGKGARAMELLAEAKSHVAENALLRAIIESEEARVLNGLGMAKASALLACKVRSAFEDFGIRWRTGSALCTEAEAYARQGRRHAAIRAIHEAVDTAEGVSSPYPLALIYRTSSQITGNKRHGDYANDVLSTIREGLVGL